MAPGVEPNPRNSVDGGAMKYVILSVGCLTCRMCSRSGSCCYVKFFSTDREEDVGVETCAVPGKVGSLAVERIGRAVRRDRPPSGFESNGVLVGHLMATISY